MATSNSSSTSNTQNKQASYSQGNSSTSSSSNTKSHTDYGSNTTSYGASYTQSNSVSKGGSHSTSTGESIGQSASQGGANTQTAGKSWASGEVSDKTQQKFDASSNDYVQSANVSNAYANLQSAIDGKPAFQSTYSDKLNEIYNQIMNRDKFSYNFNEDAMYQMYKDQYTNNGKLAMQDTMGQASALTGGYGSSYAQTAGQQTYQNYLRELNDVIPELRNQAYNEYQQEGQDLLNKYNITNQAYNNEYGQYRDDVNDWQSDRSFNYGMYSDERNFDYNQYANDRSFWQNEYWNEKNSAQSNAATSDSTNWNNSTSYQKTNSTTDSTNWSNSSTNSYGINWNKSETTGWKDTNSTTNSVSNTKSDNTSFSWGDSTTNATSNTVSSGNGSGTSGSANGVAFTSQESFPSMPSAIRSNVIQDFSQKLAKGDETGLRNEMKDLYENGYIGADGQKVNFSNEDLVNLYNRAIDTSLKYNTYSSGSSDSNKDGYKLNKRLSNTDELKSFLGIRNW